MRVRGAKASFCDVSLDSAGIAAGAQQLPRAPRGRAAGRHDVTLRGGEARMGGGAFLADPYAATQLRRLAVPAPLEVLPVPTAGGGSADGSAGEEIG